MKRLVTFAALAAALALPIALATAEDMDHGKTMMQEMSPAGAPSTAAFREADRAMMDAMAIRYTGNADIDFVRGMIPHHQGAIDMAKVELQYGKDPEIRKLAEGIIQAQQSEIAMMQAWLAKNGGATGQ